MIIKTDKKDLYIIPQICNTKCEVCNEDISKISNNIIDINIVKNVISSNKYDNINIIGGELEMYRNWEELIMLLKKKKNVNLYTNALNFEFIEKIFRIKNINVKFKILTSSLKYPILTNKNNSELIKSIELFMKNRRKYDIIIKYINDFYSMNDDYIEYRKYIKKSNKTYFIGFNKKFKNSYKDIFNFKNIVYLDT